MEDNNSLPPMQVIREPFLIRNPWFSIVMVMLFYTLFLLVPQLVYAYYVNPSFTFTHPYVLRIIEFSSLGILLMVFLPYLRIPKNNRTYRQYFIDIRISPTKLKSILVGLVFTIVVFILAYGSVYLSAILSKIYYVNVQGLFIPDAPRVVWDPSYLLDPSETLNVYYALTPGIMEEIAFRGVILMLLLKKYKWKTAVVVDGVLFGLFHLLNLLGPSLNYFGGAPGWTLDLYKAYLLSVSFQVVYAASLGIAFALLFVKSESLLACILVHWLIDAFGGLVLYPNIGFSWIYFICITLLGIGILPAILNWYIINGFYRGEPRNPWDLKTEITQF